MAALDALVEPTARGDPRSPLRWTCKSTRRLAEALQRQGFQVSDRKVAALLKETGYSLQSNRKTREGKSHPDRNAQFEYINEQALRFQRRGQPVVSVDTKKKELVGDFKNGGREWRRRGEPEEVRVHDFLDKTLGKAIPYGVYDVAHNEGWVSVGIDHDTARFATEALRRWWKKMGSLSECEGIAHHRRRRRQQRFSVSLVEGGTANVGRPDWLEAACVSFSTGYEQVEQD